MAALAFAAVPALAMEPAKLVDAELEEQAIQFVSLGDGRLSYFDAERRLSSAQVADYVSLRFTGEADEAFEAGDPGQGRLLLTDGHDLPGRLAGVEEGDRLIWDHAELGKLSIVIDDVLVMVLGEPIVTEPAADSELEAATEAEGELEVDVELDADVEPEIELDGRAADAEVAGDERHDGPRDPLELIVRAGDDRVVLRNGDVLEGFVESVDSAAVQLSLGGETLPLAWERVAAVALVNPTSTAAGKWVTLRDGTRLRVEQLAIGSDEITGQIRGERSLELAADRLRAVEFAQRHRLVTLAELEPRVVAGGVVFGVEIPPTFAREASRLHAPVTVAIELPGGAKRFAAEASLDDAALAWADLELIIRDEQGERFRAHLSADEPAVSVNVPVTGDRLEIELDEAANGPVMDRLRLHNAAVLLEN